MGQNQRGDYAGQAALVSVSPEKQGLEWRFRARPACADLQVSAAAIDGLIYQVPRSNLGAARIPTARCRRQAVAGAEITAGSSYLDSDPFVSKQEVIDLADSTFPSTPIYLEATKEGAPIYARRGFEVVGTSEYQEMARFGPKKDSQAA